MGVVSYVVEMSRSSCVCLVEGGGWHANRAGIFPSILIIINTESINRLIKFISNLG